MDEVIRTWAPNSSHIKRPSLILITPMMSSSIKGGGPPAELAAGPEAERPAFADYIELCDASI
jgi:hypothetical protein